MAFRERHIRFFISSTFADMKIERNLLRQLIEKLSFEYGKKGWEIEYIDLRWGISPEASADNRTMTICLSELALSQKVSPKPNFIMLLGERYGWRPLPEIMSKVEFSIACASANDNQLSLLLKWYEIDYNNKSDYMYRLKSCSEVGISYLVFKSEVEPELLCLFRKCVPDWDCSATELEIRNGVFSRADISDYAVAYFRKIDNLPAEEYETFFDKDIIDKDYMSLLKKKVSKALNPNNIISIYTKWEDYNSEIFKLKFLSEFEERLRRIIEIEIEQNIVDDIDYELSIHKEYTINEAKSFYGREKELEELTIYINNNNPDFPLWIRGNAGCGKSALLAKFASELYEDNSIIVFPIFSGISPSTSSARTMFIFLLRTINRFNSSKLKDISFEMNNLKIKNILYGSLNNVSSEKKYVIILDGIDQISDDDFENFDMLAWIVNEKELLPNNVKFIISSGDNWGFKVTLDRINILDLKHTKEYALDLVVNRLGYKDRILQQWQINDLDNIIKQSDCAPLYLTILSHVLEEFNDRQSLEGLPSNYGGICLQILEKLSSPEYHGRRLVRLASALLIVSPDGIDVMSLNQIMATDYELQEELMQRSFQLWDVNETKSIPPIIWSRLFYDLKDIILIRANSIIGTVIRIRNWRLMYNIIYWLEPEEIEHAACLLGEWCLNNYHTGNKMAIRNAIHSYLFLLNYKISLFNPKYSSSLEQRSVYNIAFEKVLKLIADENYIALRENFFPGEIVRDCDRIIGLNRLYGNVMYLDDLHRIKNFLSNIVLDNINIKKCGLFDVYDINECITSIQAKMLNLWDGHILHDKVKNILDNLILPDYCNNINNDMLTLHRFNDPGENTWLNNDGTALYRFVRIGKEFDFFHRRDIINDYSFRRLDLKTCSEDTILPAIGTAIRFLVSDDESVWVTLHPTHIYVCGDKVKVEIIRVRDVKWISISSDGVYLAYGGSGMKTVRVNLITGGKCSWIEADYGKMSSSGETLWLCSINEYLEDYDNPWHTVISCCEFKENKCASIKYKEKKKSACFSERILVCTDEFAIIQGRYNIHRFKDGKITSWQFNKMTPLSAACINSCLKQIYLFYLSSGAWTLLEIVNDKLHIITEGNMPMVDQISGNMQCALSINEKRVFDFNKMRETCEYNNSGNFSGINNLSSSFDGRKIVISIGRNCAWDTGELEVPIITSLCENGTWIEYKLECDVRIPCSYVSASSISPKGNLIVYSTESNPNYICFFDIKERKLIAKHTSAGSVSSIIISSDSRFVIVLTSHYFLSCDTMLYVFDDKGILLFDMVVAKNRAQDYYRIPSLSPDNRILSLIGDDVVLVDLVNRRVVMNCKNEYKEILNKNDYYVNDIDTLFHPLTGQPILRHNPKSQILKGISSDGRYVFLQTKENRLDILDIQKNTLISSLNNVKRVLPSMFENRIWVYTFDYSVACYDFHGNLLGRTWLSYDCRMHFWQENAIGIAIGKHNGHASLFPHPLSNNMSLAELKAVRRWNLASLILDGPTVICPKCGDVINRIVNKCPKCLCNLKIKRNADNKKIFYNRFFSKLLRVNSRLFFYKTKNEKAKNYVIRWVNAIDFMKDLNIQK